VVARRIRCTMRRTWGSDRRSALQQRPQGEPARSGRGEHDAPPNVRVGVGDPQRTWGSSRCGSRSSSRPSDCSRSANVGIFSGGKGPDGIKRVVSATTAEPGGAAPPGPAGALPPPAPRPDRPQEEGEGDGDGGGGTADGAVACSSCSRRAASRPSPRRCLVRVEDRAAQAGDELARSTASVSPVAHGALPLDHPREQGLAGCHQLVHASRKLGCCLFAGGDALPGRSPLRVAGHQLLRVALTLRLEELSSDLARSASECSSRRLQRGDFCTGAGDLVLDHAQALGFTGLTAAASARRMRGLIGFGARLVERAAQLLEPGTRGAGSVEPPRLACYERGAVMPSRKAKGPYVTIVKCVSSRKPGRPAPPSRCRRPAQLPSAARSVGYVMPSCSRYVRYLLGS